MLGRRMTAFVAVCVLVGVAGVGGAQAAPVTTAPDAGVWQADGRVDTVTYSPDGNTLFLGGIFHHLCPPAEAVCNGTGPGDVAVDFLAAVDAGTGAPITAFRPEPDGEVNVLVESPDGTLYAGGAFNNVAGQKHRKLAAISAATGTPVSTWKPVINSSVKALGLSPDGAIVYSGGLFTTVDAHSRPLLAAMSAYSAATPKETLLPWSPAPSGTNTFDKGSLVPATINSLVVRPGDGQVYATGVFTTIGGLTRNDVAALGPASGGGAGAAIPGFALSPVLAYVGLNVTLTRDGTTMFVNGRGPGGFVIAADSSTGSQLWARHFDGDVQAAAATDTLIYVGGHFDFISLAKTSVRDERHHLAALDTLTGKTDAWNPRANSVFGVYGMAWSPGHIAAGGDFTLIQSLPHSGLAQFSGGDTAPPSSVGDLSAASTVKGRVDLSWTASTDSDSDTLTYRIYRRPVGGTYAVLDTITGPSSATATGPVTYADSTATIGSSYEYQVRAADPVFLSPAGNDAGVTVAGDQSPPGVPTGVTASSPSAGNALVTWTGAGDGDDATLTYTVTRFDGTTSSDVGVVAGSATGTVSFQDTSSTGGTFSYTVRASDGTFTSDESTATAPVVVAADPTVPAVPATLAATSTTANTIALSWPASSDPDQDASQISYLIFRKTAGASGTGTQIARTNPGQTTFTDTTDGTIAPLPDKSYTYYVAATDGPNTSAKTTAATATVSSAIFSDDLSSLAAWTLPTKNSGVTLDTTQGHLSPPSASLIGSVSPTRGGYANRGFGAGYRTVCVKEWVSMTAYDTRSNAQTTLVRVYSTTGNDIARLYVDQKGRLWIRSDWGSSPLVTTVVVPNDGSWHSVQMCTTSTADATDGTMTAWFDSTRFANLTDLDNSTDPLGTVDIGERTPAKFSMHIDDVSAGTTPR
jgi:hypothetical protein